MWLGRAAELPLLMGWNPASHCRRQRSLVLRLLSHTIRRGGHFFHSASDLYLIRRGQIEYIWSGKLSFGVPFAQVPTLWRAVLTDRQLSCCSSWCGHFCFTTTHPVPQIIKNRYWPLWFILWQLIGVYPSQLALCFPQPRPNSQTAPFYPTYTKQVRNGQCGDLGHCLRSSSDVRFPVLRP